MTVSAADAEFRAKNLVLIHLDLEHNGYHIIQLSAIAVDPETRQSIGSEFNMYIKPPDSCPWNYGICKAPSTA